MIWKNGRYRKFGDDDIAKYTDWDNVYEVQELNEKGFVKISGRLLYYIRNNGVLDIRFFRPGTTSVSGSKGSIKYGSSDIFGDRNCYCFDTRRKKEFVDFLVAKFINMNEDPDENIRKVFTRILHQHGLHWDECRCGKKNKYDEECIENGTRNYR